ncbi:MAG TPA: TetR/AcrR family transcriptional regulator [Terracidiphilus sp.]|jgi:TetR/AcrR family transcriptional repressor of nem operon|nr:TetR/AcrR family transcriptional regulator [Terracidiphilus sp.]
MRYDAEHKSSTRRKIVKGASRQLRKKGLNGPTVATLMKGSGLTHGGFYKHFSSRDDLVVEAVEESLRELTQTLIDAAERSGARAPWKSIIKTYLSRERCDEADRGCPIAALAPDIARTPSAMKRRISAAILKFREELIPFMPGQTLEQKSLNFLMIITSMVGAIVIARTMPELAVRQAILETVRDRLLASF